jgi:GT2 family glycosyltransferase
MKIPISIVIPFYNDNKNFYEFFEQNYQMIKKNNSENQIIAIDDGKNDALVGALKNKYTDVMLIQHQTNKGFSISINDGVNAASHDVVYLLNSDILLKKHMFDAVNKHFENKNVFGVTFRSEYPDGRLREGAKTLIWKGGMPQIRHAERHFPLPDKNGNIQSVYAVGGHCAVRKSMFLELNGMDHDTFHPFYWEDTDLGIRARKNNWEIHYEPKANVVHPMENSSIKSNFRTEYINRIKFRNRTFFALKNFNSPSRRIGIRFYLTINFLKKFIQFRNVSDAYKQSLGYINSFQKLKKK